MNEEWRDVPNLVGIYKVSNLGNVKSLDRFIKVRKRRRFYKSQQIKPIKNLNGYYKVILDRKNYYLHRLVAEVFIPNPDNLPKVTHISNDLSDNSVTNLIWCDKYIPQNKPSGYRQLKSEIRKEILTQSIKDFIKDNDSWSIYDIMELTGMGESYCDKILLTLGVLAPVKKPDLRQEYIYDKLKDILDNYKGNFIKMRDLTTYEMTRYYINGFLTKYPQYSHYFVKPPKPIRVKKEKIPKVNKFKLNNKIIYENIKKFIDKKIEKGEKIREVTIAKEFGIKALKIKTFYLENFEYYQKVKEHNGNKG